LGRNVETHVSASAEMIGFHLPLFCMRALSTLTFTMSGAE
jgi:hypothetical protein